MYMYILSFLCCNHSVNFSSSPGQRVLEEILSPLVDKLQSSENDEDRMVVLDGIQQIMAIRSNVVLPMIIPHLIQPPVNIKALSLLSSVAGHALYKHLSRVIPALVTCITQHQVSFVM